MGPNLPDIADLRYNYYLSQGFQFVSKTITFTGADGTGAIAVTAVAATDTLTSNNTNVSDGDTVTIQGTAYRFKNTLAQIGDIKIGASADATLTSLAKAINGTGVAGTDMFTGTPADPNVSSSTVSAHALTFTALVTGTGGNAYTLATTAVTLTPGGATFSGGVTGVVGTINLFQVTGDVMVAVFANSLTTPAGATATIEVGIAGATAALLPTTTATTITALKLLDVTGVLATGTAPKITPNQVLAAGPKIIGTPKTANITAGKLVFYCYYRPLATGSLVAAL